MPYAVDDKRRFFKALLNKPQGPCFVFDFDGTLSPIVDEPSMATVSPALFEPLSALADLATIKVISGRPVNFLREKLKVVFESAKWPVEIFGKYGIERGTLDGGVTSTYRLNPSALEQLKSLELSMALLMPEGCFIEEKGTSTGYHFRSNPSQMEVIRDRIVENLEELGLDMLELHGGKMVFEVMIVGVPTKGSTIASFAGAFEAIFFAGDDLGDVEAFQVVADLEEPKGFTVLVRGSSVTEDLVGGVVDLIVEDQVQLATVISDFLE